MIAVSAFFVEKITILCDFFGFQNLNDEYLVMKKGIGIDHLKKKHIFLFSPSKINILKKKKKVL